MREKVKEYEVEKKELEKEKFYCDICGCDCTDEYQIVPMDLCDDCQPEEKNGYGSVEKAKVVLDNKRDELKGLEDRNSALFETMGAGFFLFLIIFYPLMFGAGIMDFIGNRDEYGKVFIYAGVSTILWGVLLYAVISLFV